MPADDAARSSSGQWDSPESKAEYARIIGELAAHQGRFIQQQKDRDASGDLTVNALIVAFWDHAERHYGQPRMRSATTELLNLQDALHLLRSMYGRIRACEFGPVRSGPIREKMIEAGLSRTTINARINRIRRVFRWGVSVELIPAPVLQALETVPGLQRGRSSAKEPEGVKPVPIERVEATLPHLNRVVAAMVRIQLLTGCRAEEVMIMRGCDLTPGEPNWEYRPAWHKTAWRGKDRVIIVGPKAQEILREFLKADPAGVPLRPARRGRGAPCRAGPEAEVTAHALGGRQAIQGPGRDRVMPITTTGRSYRQAVVRACDRAFLHPELSKIKPKKLTADQRRGAQGMAAEAPVVAPAAPAHGRDDDPVTVRPRGVAGGPGPREGRRDADLRGAGSGQGACGHGRDRLTLCRFTRFGSTSPGRTRAHR